MNKWTEKHILGLHRTGKIKSFVDQKKDKGFSSNGNTPLPRERSRALAWLDMNLLYWCNERSLQLQCSANGNELRFDDIRKWRFDYAIPSLKIAIEYEGGIFMPKSGHNTARHYTKDTEKYNRAAVLGWKVIRVTAMNYQTVLKTLDEIISY